MELKHKINKLIYEWVKDNFGESEAKDPSWSIVDLASHLADHFHEMYWEQELNYLKEDVENYAEDYGFELTEKQKWAIADKIRNSDWYCSIDCEDMEYYINQELRKEKNNDN